LGIGDRKFLDTQRELRLRLAGFLRRRLDAFGAVVAGVADGDADAECSDVLVGRGTQKAFEGGREQQEGPGISR
jgi:hypothetical protein